ncbi:hypothetical protein PVL29_013573 [Vitis rotundifolia]|uniref:Uncharacterized protein n=1 Tax=Vitis rotundifolia TaxID=103349 RepID=A0AA39DNQ7_VITRO|nr:hypothetical protein PVL29_013573 [Vitis rotundifolia]
MLKVHSYHNFRPETAYLSVTYLDCFLYPYDLQKMEEMSVPLSLDLQVMEPRFLFTAMTGQQMELLVMAVIKCLVSSPNFTVPAMFRISFSPPAE